MCASLNKLKLFSKLEINFPLKSVIKCDSLKNCFRKKTETEIPQRKDI